MIVKPIPPNEPTFGWKIAQQTTKYGRKVVQLTEYYMENGKKLLVTDRFEKGVQTTKTKELFDANWHLIKGKLINYLDQKGGKNVWRY
jgi:hypothetical protein